ncbi:hypothetical protein [Methanosphaera sp. WGK6]|uniref:hypothetical protein n=1 Tax=Methanosphaera sp. WGK6 TaxID=1561964 RepID=UPI00084C3C1D|nr:hypothetical protein [Methanosphaera sp. WGK6]OED30481.1 hypothetical protein NL43_02340 [Methanosphaera sp. WGK6]
MKLGNLIQYLLVIFLSLIIYLFCAFFDVNTSYPIIGLEVLLIVLLSLGLVYISRLGYDLEIYSIYIVLAVLLLTFWYHYALIVMISLISMAIMVCIKKITNNEFDYENII